MDHRRSTRITGLAELVHRIVGAPRLEGGLASEIFLVIVADVGAGHILVLHAGDALADLLALNVAHITEHALAAEVLFRQVVGGERRRVIGWQRDQMVEDPGALLLD